MAAKIQWVDGSGERFVEIVGIEVPRFFYMRGDAVYEAPHPSLPDGAGFSEHQACNGLRRLGNTLSVECRLGQTLLGVIKNEYRRCA